MTTHDKQGTRYSQRPVFQGQAAPLNAFDYTVYEYWMSPADQAANPADPAYTNGMPAHYVNDMGMNNHLNSDGSFVDDDANPATGKLPGFAPTLAPWAYPYPIDMDGDGLYTGPMDLPNFMMPNVREIDCMFCHMEGYNNIVSSVAVQMGALNAAPSMGAGLMNMFTQAYMTSMVDSVSMNHPMFGPVNVAMLSGNVISRIKGNPPSDNCRLCHSPTTMENFSDMFDKFLAASPMEFNPNSPYAGPTGMAMPGYDLNAAFVNPALFGMSPTVYGTTPDGAPWIYADGSDASGPFNGQFPMALFETYKNEQPLNPMMGEMGGNNTPGSGPIYFAGGGTMDQGALKKATIPFPRADFFKRGDLWDDRSAEVHHSLECAGCHMDTATAGVSDGKDQCDPGRGYARLGGVESGALGADDSRNSVKRCENCHITGKNNEGVTIETFGAPNATYKHELAGLNANITNAYGYNDATGVIEEFTGNHIDVVDCTVCHMKKVSMAVRALDCTSGNRYPTMTGYQQQYGMMAMFTDPMGLGDVPEDDPIWEQLGGPGATKEMFVHEVIEWSTMPQYDLLKGWWQNGPTTINGNPNPDFRRKVYNINMITAILFDNDGDFDANGDTFTGVQADAQAPAGALGFDPWIQRDLKAGMTFADTGFAAVPIGFGGGAYQSVYDPNNANGFVAAANQQWDYVGVYGGNIMFSTPEQINDYQAYRTGLDSTLAAGNKPWDDTKLTIFGGPFQVTHNIVATADNALGQSCNDCHDAGSHFFSGGYDMTGSAVPTADTVDMTGIYDITQANGGMIMDISAYNMMQRPVVDYEVVADEEDLVTGGEAQSKTGTVHEVEFEEHGCWDGADFIVHSAATDSDEGGDGTCNAADATYVRTTDMSRSEFLYFDVLNTLGDETLFEDFIDELETNRTAADYGIGVNPVAVIDLDASSLSTTAGGTVTIVADTTVNTQGTFTYSWQLLDGSAATATGDTAIFTCNTVGTHPVLLTVTDEEGKTSSANTSISVTPALPPSDFTYNDNDPLADTVSIAGLLPHTMLYIRWGDGTISRVTTTLDEVEKTYASGTYNVLVYVYNGRARVQYKTGTITVP